MSIPRSPSGRTALAGVALSADLEKRKLQEKELLHQQQHAYYAHQQQQQQQTPGQGSTPSTGPSGTGATQEQAKPASRAMVVFSVLFYLVAALVMVMANKWVLNSVQVPLFFLFVQLVIAVLLLHLSAIFGYFTIPHVHLATCKGLLPLVSINVTGLIFNTYCLQYVDASFYQVARGLVLPFTVFFSWWLLSARSSSLSLSGVAVVCLGFFLGVSSESLHASTTGTLLGVFSSLTTSVHAIVVKKSLGVVKGSTMDLVYYNNLLSACLLSPLVILSGESAAVSDMLAAGGKPLQTFIYGASVTGCFGFLICIAGFLSIKVTSPVTHMISSAVRGVIQTFLGMWLFGDIITAGRGFGILFILLGSGLYTWAKEQEHRVREAIASHGSAFSPSSSTSSSASSPASPGPTMKLSAPNGYSQGHGNWKNLAINTSEPSSANGTTSRESSEEDGPHTPRSAVLGQHEHASSPFAHAHAHGTTGTTSAYTYSAGTPSRAHSLSPSAHNGAAQPLHLRRQSGDANVNAYHSPLRDSSAAPGTGTGTGRRLSYNAQQQQYQPQHAKNGSLTDLMDVVVNPSNLAGRGKEEKVC